MTAFRQIFLGILTSFWLHFDWISTSFRLHFDFISTAFRLHFDWIVYLWNKIKSELTSVLVVGWNLNVLWSGKTWNYKMLFALTLKLRTNWRQKKFAVEKFQFSKLIMTSIMISHIFYFCTFSSVLFQSIFFSLKQIWWCIGGIF